MSDSKTSTAETTHQSYPWQDDARSLLATVERTLTRLLIHAEGEDEADALEALRAVSAVEATLPSAEPPKHPSNQNRPDGSMALRLVDRVELREAVGDIRAALLELLEVKVEEIGMPYLKSIACSASFIHENLRLDDVPDLDTYIAQRDAENAGTPSLTGGSDAS